MQGARGRELWGSLKVSRGLVVWFWENHSSVVFLYAGWGTSSSGLADLYGEPETGLAQGKGALVFVRILSFDFDRGRR